MKKISIFILIISTFLSAKSVHAWTFSLVDYAFTTDIIETIDKEYYQVEFLSVLAHNMAWSARVGYYRKLEDSDTKYSGNNRHWEIGFRWRYFFLERAPNLLFFGIGFDNRYQDNSITPTAEVGANICIKPLFLGVLGFVGYEFHWEDSTTKNRWVKGVEARVGICF